jgi:hypothetical protein
VETGLPENDRMKTTALKVLLPVCVGLLTLFAGYEWLWETNPDQQTLARTVERSEHVFELYFTGDYGRASDTILDHISQLDKLDADSGRPARNPYAVDAMFWYVRLAKLEEKNDSTRKAEYMRDACSRCQKLGWADCAEEKLRSDVDRMDSIASQH